MSSPLHVNLVYIVYRDVSITGHRIVQVSANGHVTVTATVLSWQRTAKQWRTVKEKQLQHENIHKLPSNNEIQETTPEMTTNELRNDKLQELRVTEKKTGTAGERDERRKGGRPGRE